MQLKFVSLMVEDQERALAFYTSVLGFTPCADISMGEHRWLTVTAPGGLPGVELVLEPMAFPPARVFQQALYEAGIPATALMTTDIAGDFARLRERGVHFRGEPREMGPVTAVSFDDGCGNLIQLVQAMG